MSLKPGYRREDVLARIDAVLAKIPGIHGETGQPISHRLSHILSGTPAAIAISVFGEDLPTLRRIAREVEAELKKLPGTRDVTGNREAMVTTLPIRYRHDDLRRFGLTPAGAAEQVTAAMFGEVVAEVNEGVRRYDIVVRLDPESRRGVQDVRDLVLRGKGGAMVRLREVADIGPEDARDGDPAGERPPQGRDLHQRRRGPQPRPPRRRGEAGRGPDRRPQRLRGSLRRAVRGPAVGVEDDLPHGRRRDPRDPAAALHGVRELPRRACW